MSIFLMMMAVSLVFIFLGTSVSFSIRLPAVVAALAEGMLLAFTSQMAFMGSDSYTYLAILMFIPVGYLMETGGLLERLVNFAASLMRNIHGELGIIAVLACAFLAAISGSSPSTVVAVGAMMIPPMVEKGYGRDFPAALTANVGSSGVLIPPSIPTVLYCIIGEMSVREVFMAGLIPGFLMTAVLALTTYVISKKNEYKSDEREFEWKKVAASLKEVIWPLLVPVIILDGIYSSILTLTEVTVVIVVYSMPVRLFITKELKMSDLPGILHKGAATAGTAVPILAFAMAFSRYLTLNQIPQLIGNVTLGITGNVHVILILFVLLCFVIGTFPETVFQVLICIPLFLPALERPGVSPLHSDILLTVGTMLDIMTPPVGISLFVTRGISGAKISKVTKVILPFLSVMLFVQMLFMFFPSFSISFPGLFLK